MITVTENVSGLLEEIVRSQLCGLYQQPTVGENNTLSKVSQSVIRDGREYCWKKGGNLCLKPVI